MSSGDWATFWELFPIPVPEPARNYIEAVNDPRAIAACIIGGSGDADWRSFTSPAIGYVGDDEPFGELNRSVGREIGMPMAILPTGSHDETWNSAAEVLTVVEPYL